MKSIVRLLSSFCCISMLSCGSSGDVDNAIEKLESLGGIVQRDPKNPSRIRMLLIRERPVVDEDLKCLANMSEIDKIYLANTKVTGSGLLNLKKPESVNSLVLEHCPVDNKGMGAFSRLVKLEELIVIGANRITNAGLDAIFGLRRLKVLEILGTKIDDNALEKMRSLVRA